MNAHPARLLGFEALLPEISMHPLVGKTSPKSIFMEVVFPDPLGPTNPVMPPRATENDKSLTAGTFVPQKPFR